MTYDVLGPGPLDYLPCRYGDSKLLFRGPKRDLDTPYVAFLGGTETYGKFIETPFPSLVEEGIGMTCANFGQINAGIDAYASDPFVLNAAHHAHVSVVQILGTQNMTNRFYAVHPRRNDRFVEASKLLRTIFREVDFTDFAYNKHMLQALVDVSVDRFEAVREELQDAWLARMKLLLRQIKGKSVLLWMAPEPPADLVRPGAHGLGNEPLFVTAAMVDELAPFATRVVEVVVSPEAIAAGTEGMLFNDMERAAAQEVMGPIAHQEAARALVKVIEELS